MENSKFQIQDCGWSCEPGITNPFQENKKIGRGITSIIDSRSQDLPGVVSKPGVNNKVMTCETLIENILLLLCVPFESSCHCIEWVANHNLFIYDTSNTEYVLAVKCIQRRTALSSFNQLLEYHQNAKFPTYYARNKNHYLSLDDSIRHVEDLLFFQYKENVKGFIERLFIITEKKLPKKNSMFIVGKPNSGKTWFIDMVAAFHLNIGNVKNVVRGQNFPFNDCINRRMLIWNEPSIMPSGFDSVKMLAGGDPCPTSIKYQGDGTITRTPLIFTSNKNIFSTYDSVWTSRMYFESWEPCSLLKDINGYPHPMTFKYLIDKYIFNQ